MIAILAPIVRAGGGKPPGPFDWNLLVERTDPGRWQFVVLDGTGDAVVRCTLDVSGYDAQLVADLQPAAVLLTEHSLMALADLERCVAWTIAEEWPR